jgi:hypothetical protein
VEAVRERAAPRAHERAAQQLLRVLLPRLVLVRAAAGVVVASPAAAAVVAVR